MTSRLGARIAAVVVGLGALAGLSLVFAPAASAHPLGNFTTNTAMSLRLSADRIDVAYAIDTAEIPTLRAKAAVDTDGDGSPSATELAAYRETTCAAVVKATDLTVDGAPVSLRLSGGDQSLAAGAAGLQTMRLDCTMSAKVDLSSDDHRVEVTNGWIGDRIGWHEIVAVGDGVTLTDSEVPTASTSDNLRAYPADQLAAPPDVRRASISTTPGGPAAGAETPTANGGRRVDTGSISALPGVDRASESFTDLVSKEKLTLGVALIGLVLAILLGSLHALAPGHGKTVMAAYLLGGEGSGRQALALCATVTVTHTAGVLVLGTALTVTTVVAPERLYPILGAISGLLVASIGVTMLRRARKARTTGYFGTIGHSHPHTAEHSHAHHDDHSQEGTPHSHSHDHSHEPDLVVARPARQLVGIGAGVGVGVGPGSRAVARTAAPRPTPPAASTHSHDAGAHPHPHPHPHPHEAHSHGGHSHVHPSEGEHVSWKSLIGMGFAGGMVPSPSALLVLLGAIALGRTWFGVALVIAYGVGMAVSLVAAGLLLLRLRNRLDRFLSTRKGARMSKRMAIMPVLTATLVVIGGLYIAVRAGLQY